MSQSLRNFLLGGLIVVAASAAPAGQAARSLTLDECLSLALENSHGLKASGYRAETASAQALQARAARFSPLKLSGGYTRLSEVPPFEVNLPLGSIPGLSFLPASFVVSPQFQNSYSLKLSMQQPVFAGFRLRSTAALAADQAMAAAEDLAGDRAELILTVKTAYWSLYKARALEKLAGDSVAALEAHLTDARNLQSAGLLIQAEILKVEAQLATARLQNLDAGNAVRMAEVLLASLTGLPLSTAIEPATPAESTPPETAGAIGAGAAEMAGQARARRPEMRALDLRIKAGEQAVVAAKGTAYPQVFVFGDFYLARPNPRIMPSKDAWKDTWDLGIGVSIDLWAWGQTRHQTAQAEAQLAQVREIKLQAEDALNVEVTQAVLALDQSRARIAAALAAVGQAEENRRAANDRFKAGSASATDVLDAEILLLQARTQHTQALVDREMAKARIVKVTGA